MSALSSPFIRQITEMPCLGNFISTSFFEGGPLVPRHVAVECARVMREAGWEVPPQLEALEDETNRNVVAAVAGPRVKSEVVAPAPSGQNDATAPPTIDGAF